MWEGALFMKLLIVHHVRPCFRYPGSQRLSFNIIFFHGINLESMLFSIGNLRREALIEAPSREKKKASGRDRWESHFHAGSALDSCQRCHFLLTNHKGGSDWQFVDRAGWVSSPVLRNKLLRRERRGAFSVCRVYKLSNFQGLVFIPKRDKLLLWHLKWKGKT